MASIEIKTLAAALVLAHVMAVGLPGRAAANAFFPDTAGHWAQAGVEWAVGQGIAQGYADGSFHPDRTVTEAEFLTMLFRAAPVAEAVYEPALSSESGAAHWADAVYRKAAQLNYPASGIAERSRRDLPVTRLKAAEIMAGAYGYSYEGDEAVVFVMANGLAGGKDDSFSVDGYRGSDPVTRAEAVELIRRSRVRVLCRPEEPALAALKARPAPGKESGAGSALPYCRQPHPSKPSAEGAPAAAEQQQTASAPSVQAGQAGTPSAEDGDSRLRQVFYQVRQGDTLFRISRMFGVSVQALSEANGLADPGSLSVGQRLLIPGLELPSELEEVTVVHVLPSILTAYTAGYESTGKTPSHPAYGITRSGTTVEEGRTVAVDPAVIPIGSKVYIEGIGFRTAEDTGRAITGNRLDLYIEDLEEALRFGVKSGVMVFVLA